MKKISVGKMSSAAITLFFILAIVLTGALTFGAVIGYRAYHENNFSYSFGPQGDFTGQKPDAARKKFLKDKLSEAGKFPEGISVLPIKTYTDGEENIIVECFIRNNTGRNILNLKGNISIKKGNDVVADGYFELPVGVFGRLEDHKARPWKIQFLKDHVYDAEADLTQYTILVNMNYEY